MPFRLASIATQPRLDAHQTITGDQSFAEDNIACTVRDGGRQTPIESFHHFHIPRRRPSNAGAAAPPVRQR